jgi:predicted amidophosphoribosyltransferase
VNGTKPMQDYLSEKAGVQVHAVGVPFGHPARQKGGSVEPILTQFGVKLNETILVGARDEDMRAGVNNKLLLLRPAWYNSELKYGFELESISKLSRFCLIFGTRTHPIYWRVSDATHNVHVAAMGPFSTMIEAYAKFGSDAVAAAKYEAGTLEFWHQLITSTLYFSGIIHQVDLIAVYPGHESGIKEKAFYEVLSLLGKCFRKTFYVDLLLRHKDAAKSQPTKAALRKFTEQVNTLRLNRYPRQFGQVPRTSQIPLNGKTVLVVDDICTSGRSMDTARAYFAAAGARTILFSWLKTINTDFVSMQPAPTLMPFDVNIIKSEPTSVSYGYVSHIVDGQAPTEIDNVLKQFQSWK